MYPLNFLAVVIAGLSAITSTDARVAKRNPSDIEENGNTNFLYSYYYIVNMYLF